MGTWIDIALNLGVPAALLVVGYLAGSQAEKAHFRSIRRREDASKHFPVVTFRTPPDGWQIEASDLTTGNVVVSLDYFKRFLARLRGLVGGRIRSYETLMDRGRRK